MYAMFHKLTQPMRATVLAGLLGLPVLAALPARTLLAQGAVTGAIGGTVTDSNGALLPGTLVTITSKDQGTVRKTKTNSSGEYRVPELQPGIYTITYTADGFETEQQNNVEVTVGGLANVSPKLTVGSVSDKVEVSGEAPLMHTESNDISTTIDQETIDNLPINGRRWSNFALLTPGVVSNSDGFGLLSFRGVSYLLNNNEVDGADDNQAYFSEARGRTRTSYAITQVAVQEFQVNTSNYSAEYGRAAGGVINTVTKSGTNQLHGELFFYDRDNDLGGATNPYTLLTTQNAAGTFVTYPYKPKDWRKQWGFGVGGALIKDKLFFFYAYDQSRRNFPGTARASDPTDTFAPADNFLPTGASCSGGTLGGTTTGVQHGDQYACSLAYALNLGSGAAAYQQGAAYYSQGLGIINSFLGTVPRFLDQVINYPKLDYQISDRERLSLSYNRLRSTSPNGIQTQTSNFYGVESFGNDFVKEDFGIARLTSVLSNSIVNSALVQYGRDFEYEYSDPPAPNEEPLSKNAFQRPPEVQIGYNFDNTGFDIGKSNILDRAALPDERRLELKDDLTWSHGKHVTKFGLDYNKVSDFISNLYDGNGNYSYDYQWDFIADYLHATTGLGGAGYTQQYYSFGQGFGSATDLITTREYDGYATDDWRITPRLTLTLGLRYEYEYVPPSPTPNLGNPGLYSAFSSPNAILPTSLPAPGSLAATGIPSSVFHPDDRNNFGPRVGFAFNVFGDNNTILRGGYGLYYGRMINSNILQTYLESGGPNAQVNFSSLYGPPPANSTTGVSTACGPNFPNIVGSAQDIYNCYADARVGGVGTGAPISPLGAKSTANPNGGGTTTAASFPTSTVAYLDSSYRNPEVHEADMAIDQNLGHGTVLSISYISSFGRELPSSIDTNASLNTTYNYTFNVVDNPVTAASGYVVLPHGGKPAPLVNGTSFTTRVYLQPSGNAANTRTNPYYGQILAIRSNVNSNYNALAFQLNKRYSHGFSLLSNYTWSHGLDYNPYVGTGVPTFNVYDPNSPSMEYGNSSTDVRNRFVAAAVYEPQTNFHGWKQETLGGWRIAPVVQVQNGLPFTPTISGSASGLTVPNGVFGCTKSSCAVTLAYKGLNGSGSSANRLPNIERDQFTRPKTTVVDLRVGKNFYFDALRERMRLELLCEAFNLMNHQNITGENYGAYQLSGTTLTSVPTYATYNNANSNTVYSQRQLQIAARLHF